MALLREDVTRLYVASFNRAPDAAGLSYWMNDTMITNLEDMATAFMQSAEMTALYPIAQTNTEFVQSMYSNMFGRAADASGLAYWVEQLDNGTLPKESMIQTLINGAIAGTGSVGDADVLNNKTTVGLAYADAGLNDIPDATAVMASVTSDPATVTVALASVTTLQTEAAAAAAAIEAAAAAAAAASAAAIAAASAAAAAAAEAAGYTFQLTSTDGDQFTGGTGPDTVNGTYGNGAGPYTLQAGDILAGGDGTDTLNITTGAEASTPGDGLWANKTDFETIVFNSTGAGAQTVTTGANFAAAFTTGADLSVQTLEGAITVDMTGYTPTATITTTTIGAGAHTIVTGTGVATVIATAQADGAQTINGVGLTTVTASITGAGDQTIGTTTSGSLITVNATISGAGAQTIQSTSSSAVTVVASAFAGIQTITTAGGADSITLTSAAGQNNTVSTGAGIDTIIGSLGNDTITGGLGADTMTGGLGTDSFVVAGGDTGITLATADRIVDFTTAADVITTSLGAGNVTIADGGALAAAADSGLAAFIVAADAVLTFGAGVNDAYMAYNAAATGNGYLVIDENDSGSVDAGDTMMILTGINLVGEFVLADIA
ncbi:MAG: DUF4214 domain-containing protein [Sulfurimonas sp.]|nr:DUF4214 domain-containing protein [Sulfurimonas sp.]